MKTLDGLNPSQRDAVTYVGGPTLIFAGAGSGKTKVLAHKVAYLIEKRVVAPQHILAVTFTNKAARELRERISLYVGPKAQQVQIGTFHSICARLLRREIQVLGFSPNFAIYDEEDQLALLKKIISDKGIILDNTKPQVLHNRISYLKNQLIMPESFVPRKGNLTDRLVADVYPLYNQGLAKNQAVDFDDLLILPLKIFQQVPEVLAKYRQVFQYILVDEYQDTNRPQFLFVEALAKEHRRICVVGDDDQSIYSWRGADIQNILRFHEVFPDCRIFKLEQNYRSTNNILKAASAMVSNNLKRAPKTLWSDQESGELLGRISAETEYDEAAQIAAGILFEVNRHKRRFSDIVILYRTNAQTRVLEEILRRNNIVYNIIGGVRFYERKEIKDLLAFFRVIVNPHDDISLKRIINFPPRGIGKISLQILEQKASAQGSSLFAVISQVADLDLNLRSSETIGEFANLIGDLQKLRSKFKLDEWARICVDKLGLRPYYKEHEGEEAVEHLANLDELLNDITEYCQTTAEPTLENYLENVSLMTPIDEWQENKNAVSLMTLHSAKGLEFPVVFICGLNQGLLPLERDISPESLEEERRLFYVGLTRAKEKVYLSNARWRMRAGEEFPAAESIFLNEIPNELMTSCNFVGGVIKPRRKSLGGTETGDQVTGEPRRSNGQFKVGQIVTHKIFGYGRVEAVVGSGPEAHVTVWFQSCGRKTIVARFLSGSPS